MRLKDISNFLSYHLSKSFNNKKKSFHKFLKMVLLQYEKVFFNKRVSKMVKQYFKPSLVSIKKSIQKAKPRKPKTNYQTLLLRAFQNNSAYIKKHIVDFMNTWSALKKENFIHKETSFESFKAIFKDKPIDSKNRIKWTGTNKELQWFVKYLIYDSKKVLNLDSDICLVTINCFVKSDGKEFTESQLKECFWNSIKAKKNNRVLIIKPLKICMLMRSYRRTVRS